MVTSWRSTCWRKPSRACRHSRPHRLGTPAITGRRIHGIPRRSCAAISIVKKTVMLCAEHITVSAGERVLCRGLDMAIGPKELWAILGVNGSGKTTLMHVLAGLDPPTAGRVVFESQPLQDYPK